MEEAVSKLLISFKIFVIIKRININVGKLENQDYLIRKFNLFKILPLRYPRGTFWCSSFYCIELILVG